MAKVTFTKLGLKPNKDVNIINFNNQEIEVIKYLPIEEQIKFTTEILNETAEDENYANPLKVDFFFTLGIIEYYTNISFTDKQKEDKFKLYDLIVGSGLYTEVLKAIPQEELERVTSGVYRAIEAIYNYRNSMVGILETIKTDYSNLSLDTTKIQQELGNPETVGLVKEILTNLG